MAEYIEREKVYNMLNSLGGCGADPDTWADGWDKAFDEAIRELDNIPAADVRPERHGEWKGYTTSAFHGVDQFGDPIYRDVNVWKCSECFRKSVIKENFCPKCGAMMDGGMVRAGDV